MNLYCFRNSLAYTDTSAKTIGVLPPNAKILDVKIIVKTAFNAGGNDYVDVGITGTANKFVNDANVASTGVASVTLTGAGVVEDATGVTPIIATYVPSGTAATAGAAEIVVSYYFDEA